MNLTKKQLETIKTLAFFYKRKDHDDIDYLISEKSIAPNAFKALYKKEYLENLNTLAGIAREINNNYDNGIDEYHLSAPWMYIIQDEKNVENFAHQLAKAIREMEKEE